MNLYTKEHVIARNKGKVYQGKIFSSDAAFSREAKPVYQFPLPIISGGAYFNSGARKRYLESKVEPLRKALIAGKERNAATGYDAATLSQFAAVTIVDILRIADELADYTETMYNITDNAEATAEVKIRDLMPFTVVPGEIGGTGDLAPLMEHRIGVVEEVVLKIIGFGDKSMLREILWSPNYDLIAESAARAIADYRNSLVFNDMVAATYDANHSVPFSTAGNASPDELIYKTIKAAYAKAMGLKNPLTGRKLATTAFECSLYVSKEDELNVRPIVEGVLAGAGGVRIVASALPVTNFVSYSGGNQDGEPYQGSTAKFPGVQPGYGYLHLKARDGAQLIRKIDWQPEFQQGQMRIKGEERYWWTVFGAYNANVLPSTVGSDYYGAIIKFPLSA